MKSKGVNVFLAYASEDRVYRDELEQHLNSLKRDGLIDVFHDGKIDTTDDWETVLNEQLKKSELVIFLLSHHLLRSDFIFDKEILPSLERRDSSNLLLDHG